MYGVSLPQGFWIFLVFMLWWMVYGLCLVLLKYICRSGLGTCNWYQSTLLGQRREDLFSLFAEFFFREEKEGGAFQVHIWRFMSWIWKKKIGYLNSSQKNTQFQKNNHPKRSQGSEVIIILNSTIFRGFFFSKKATRFTL